MLGGLEARQFPQPSARTMQSPKRAGDDGHIRCKLDFRRKKPNAPPDGAAQQAPVPPHNKLVTLSEAAARQESESPRPTPPRLTQASQQPAPTPPGGTQTGTGTTALTGQGDLTSSADSQVPDQAADRLVRAVLPGAGFDVPGAVQAKLHCLQLIVARNLHCLLADVHNA